MAFKRLYDIDEFIADNVLNSRIYKVLLYLQDSNNNDRIPLRRKPIEIFNQAYFICDKLESEKHPENVVQTLVQKTSETFLDYETSVIFSCVYVILSFSDTENPNITYCLHRIKNLVQENYFSEFLPIMEEDLFMVKSLPKDFQNLKEQANSISDLNERILFYNDVLTRFKQSKSKGNIIQQITDEINLIKEMQNLSNTSSNTDSESTNPEFTTKVRSVVIMELLKKMDCGKSVNDLSAICRLIAFLTNRSYEKIYNEAQKGITLTNYHNEEITKANEILSALNTNISIRKNKQY